MITICFKAANGSGPADLYEPLQTATCLHFVSYMHFSFPNRARQRG